ncbi:MAG: DUF1570 domain-containing protein [Planctomycetaceae bacterium]
MTQTVLRRPVWRRLCTWIGVIVCGALLPPAIHAQPRPAARSTDRQASPPRPSGLLRQSDRRLLVDRAAVQAQGIARYESRRLILYTDIPRERAESLPKLMDRAYDAWISYCGELPPDRERSEFQMTGYLMSDHDRFRAAGLLPDNLPDFEHGRHRGQEFWMNDQGSDYYRAHLMLHEGTHCFTTAVDRDLTRSVWFFEGIAEYFATHRYPNEGPPVFGVWPDQRTAFPLLGRIKLLEEHRARADTLSMVQVARQPPEVYDRPHAYAWAWALVHFLAEFPETRDSFRQTVQRVVRGESHAPLDQLLSDERRQRLWRWYIADLCHGYELGRSLPSSKDFELMHELGQEVSVRADRGWQSIGVRLQAGQTYRISARGRVELASEPRPWISEPAGVSIRYHAGLPLGRLIGRYWPMDSGSMQDSETISIGEKEIYSPSEDGVLFVRVNDFWNELGDNRGEYAVTVNRDE